MLPIRTIFHPTDFSEPARAAFHLACSLARDHGAHLILMHVAEPLLEYRVTASLVHNGEGGTDQTSAEKYKAELQEKLRQFAVEPPVAADYEVVEGDPAEQILNYAQKMNSDLIVMGTHGRTGLGRLLMGSVAEKVLRRAPCPVLTVKVALPEEPASTVAKQDQSEPRESR